MREVKPPDTQDGASSVEYGLVISGVAVLIVAAVFLFGGMVTGLFSGTCHAVNSQVISHGGAAATCN